MGDIGGHHERLHRGVCLMPPEQTAVLPVEVVHAPMVVAAAKRARGHVGAIAGHLDEVHIRIGLVIPDLMPLRIEVDELIAHRTYYEPAIARHCKVGAWSLRSECVVPEDVASVVEVEDPVLIVGGYPRPV